MAIHLGWRVERVLLCCFEVDRFYLDQSSVKLPFADALQRVNRFFAASIARFGLRADRMRIERWQHRKSLSLLAISLMKRTR
jgi:hypothetical protein